MMTEMSAKEAPLDSDAQVSTTCQHYWMIDKPAGPVSTGVCRVCGEEREFRNYVEGSSWSNDVTLDQLAGRSRIPAGINVGGAGEGPTADEDA